MYVHEALAQSLVDQGVTTMFGVIGDANLYMVDHFQGIDGSRYIGSAHESGAVLMANGYASVSEGIGVATVTHGPALTNSVTALVECVRNRAPVLVVAGDTETGSTTNSQDIDQRDIVLSTGAGFELVRTAETMYEALTAATRRAEVELRPIVLNVPVDLMWQKVEYRKTPPRFHYQPIRASRDALEQAASVIATARRPIVVAGRGARHAKDNVARLADRIGAPVATTLLGRNLFREHSHDLGIFGSLSRDGTSSAIANSDCIIAFGASLSNYTTMDGALVAGKSVVQVDTDPARIAINVEPTVGVVGDASAVAADLIALIDELEHQPTSYRDTDPSWFHTSDWISPTDKSSPIEFIDALHALERAIPANRTYAIDTGRFVFKALTAFSVAEPRLFINTISFGSIGLATATAIGAAAAEPDRPALAVCGDGGFVSGGLNEFNTAVRNSLDLIVVILNDSAYGAEHIQLRDKKMDPSISTFQWPTFAAVAESLGGTGVTVTSLNDISHVETAIERRDRPILIDVKLDPDKITM